MKTLLATLLTFWSLALFANEPTANTAPAVQPITAAPAQKTAAVGKMSRKAAKKACHEEGKKGKDLKTCIKEKLS
ncbi:MAG: hypothetical protein HYR96_05395 [Deltaproteobacteria bacterium]|nr:hypothetical protein [Deltaproteobacteria bacterium]MBI3295598.1 hypothetical protein [Deltaproteobacteria bacterium]